MKFHIIAVLFIFCVNIALSAKPKSSNDYYDKTFLGESQFDLYYGPHDPSLKKSSHLGHSRFADEYYFNRFINDLVQNDLFDVESFWSHEVQGMNSCPNFYLNKNLNYIRYLYRLITVSYLFESIKDHATLAYRLGYEENTCELDWRSVFGRCAPKSVDMKRFIRRTKYRYLKNYDTRKFKKMSKKDQQQWLKEALPSLVAQNSAITYRRLAEELRKTNEKKFTSLDQVQKVLKKTCQQDKELIELICSEQDDLYGISWLRRPMGLLAGSNVMRTLNKGGFANACLQRYGVLNKEKEMKYKHLENLFPAVYDLLQKNLSSSTYIEGELFLPGALKEFDDRGLEDFLFVKPKVVTKKIVAAPKSKPKPKPLPKPKPKPLPKPVIVKVKPPKPAPKAIPLSSFETAVKKVREGSKLAKVDMEKFKKDFTFSKRMVKALSAPLADYQTRQALKDMKTYDKLGSKEEPLRLLFLKFLIDRDAHSGLWNVVAVIGDRFYVINDIDKKKKPVAIKMSNDSESNYKWQLSVIEESKMAY